MDECTVGLLQKKWRVSYEFNHKAALQKHSNSCSVSGPASASGGGTAVSAEAAALTAAQEYNKNSDWVMKLLVDYVGTHWEQGST